MSEEQNILDGDNGKEMTPEERRLVALLAEMPKRHCPPRVRENVLAALRRQAEGEAGPIEVTEAPRARIIALPFRRRMLRILEVAAVLAVAAIGLKVYHDVRPRAGIEMDELTRKAAAPTSKPKETGGIADKESPLPVSEFNYIEKETGAAREHGVGKAEGREEPVDNLDTGKADEAGKAAGDALTEAKGGIEKENDAGFGRAYFKDYAPDRYGKAETSPKIGEALLKTTPSPGSAAKLVSGPGMPAGPPATVLPSLVPTQSLPAAAPAPAPPARSLAEKPAAPVALLSSSGVMVAGETAPTDAAKVGLEPKGGAMKVAGGVEGARKPAVEAETQPKTPAYGTVNGASRRLEKAEATATLTGASTVLGATGFGGGFGYDLKKGEGISATAKRGMGQPARTSDAITAAGKASGPVPDANGSVVGERMDQVAGVSEKAKALDQSGRPLRDTQREGSERLRLAGKAGQQEEKAVAQKAPTEQEKGQQINVAQDLFYRQGDLNWIEIESSAPVQQQIIARNNIDEIRVPPAPEPAVTQVAQRTDGDTTWTQFVQNAVASFGQLVGSFGGTITETQEVVVMPRARHAVVVECNIPAPNGSVLISAVNQKRMVAVSNEWGNQANVDGRLVLEQTKEAGSGGRATSTGRALFQSVTPEDRQRQRPMDALSQLAGNLRAGQFYGQNQMPVQRMNEEELANNRLPTVSNFYVQTPPARQTELYANRRSARSMQIVEQARFGQQRNVMGRGQQDTFNAQIGTSVTPTAWGIANAPGGGVVGGANVGQQRGVPIQETRLYFVLEPDRLPLQVVPSAARTQPASR
jgi:hypothetical protein